jgi:hypothetical protein
MNLKTAPQRGVNFDYIMWLFTRLSALARFGRSDSRPTIALRSCPDGRRPPARLMVLVVLQTQSRSQVRLLLATTGPPTGASPEPCLPYRAVAPSPSVCHYLLSLPPHY